MKKILILFSFLILFSIGFMQNAGLAYAQTNNINPQIAPLTNPDVPQNLHTYAQSVLIEVLSAVSCQVSGIGFGDNGKCLGLDTKTGKLGYVSAENQGAIGFMSTALAKTTSSVNISSKDYYAYLFQNFGIAKPAYAQTGYGFNQLQPVLSLWQTFRNVAYLVIIILFVIIGLGIMLRIQIDPRTVMTIQNQIPKAIIGIVLITLSYAIAGYLIDLMWVVTYFILNLFASNDPALRAAIGNSAASVNGTPMDFVNQLFGATVNNALINPVATGTSTLNVGGFLLAFNAALSAGKVISSLAQAAIASNALSQSLSTVFTLTPPGLILWLSCVLSTNFHPSIFPLNLGFNPSSFQGCVNQAAGSVAGVLGGLIAFLIFSIALLIALIRLWFALIKSMVFIYLDVIFAPLWIISGVLPGGGGFGSWFRDLISNLAVFPTAITMFLIGKVLIDGVSGGGGNYFLPPLIGNFGGSDGAALVSGLIGFGIVLMTPAAVNMVRDTLKAPQFKYISAVGQSLGAGQAVGSAGIGFSWNRLTRPYNRQTGAPQGPLRTWAVGQPGNRSRWQQRFASILGEGEQQHH